VSDVNAGRLKVLNIPELKLKRSIYIAVHKNRQSSSLIKAFVDILKKYRER
jgi:DNA-binding transcriptional LysR family regulator